jgi:hypothetical protein
MRTDYLRIGPNLDILVLWSSRMSEVLDKRYKTQMLGIPEGNEQLRREYECWYRARDAAFDQIHRFYTLTNSLPVAGDRLEVRYQDGGETLRIEQRMLFSIADSEDVLLVYEVSSDEIEALEHEFVDETDSGSNSPTLPSYPNS